MKWTKGTDIGISTGTKEHAREYEPERLQDNQTMPPRARQEESETEEEEEQDSELEPYLPPCRLAQKSFRQLPALREARDDEGLEILTCMPALVGRVKKSSRAAEAGQ